MRYFPEKQGKGQQRGIIPNLLNDPTQILTATVGGGGGGVNFYSLLKLRRSQAVLREFVSFAFSDLPFH